MKYINHITINTICSVLLVALVAPSLHAQTIEQRQRLESFTIEESARWQIRRAEAIILARQLGIPIRSTHNGVTRGLQQFENGIPIFFTTSNLTGAQTISTHKVWPGGGNGFNLTGSTETLGIWDAGRVRREHQEFQLNRVTIKDGANENSDHATHVAGTMVARGIDANSKGMAYQGLLHAWDWDNDLSEITGAASTGLKVSNHSYGSITGWDFGDYNNGEGAMWHWHGDLTINPSKSYRFGFYTTRARDVDYIAFNAPSYLIVTAAGNDRLESPVDQPIIHSHNGVGSFDDEHDVDCFPEGYDCLEGMALAKNVLTVGAVEDIPSSYINNYDVVMSDFSSWGPTDDGRIKPDIVANGTDVYSTYHTDNVSYASFSGTSMASPTVSGSIGLLLQYHRTLYGSNPIKSSTLKGIVIHTADDAGPDLGPDYKFGWGLMNTSSAINHMHQNHLNGGLHIKEQSLSAGNELVIWLRSEGNEPLRATIVWTDPAGEVSQASLNPIDKKLVNDLDLRLTSSTGNTHFPFVLNPNTPTLSATTGDNERDNVEQVHIESPEWGLYTLRISHKGALVGTSQAVSIIISGNINPGLVVTQRLENGNIVGDIAKWQAGTGFVTFPAPKYFNIANGTTETIRGSQAILSGQKFNRWDDIPNFQNHQSFQVISGFHQLVSELKPTELGVVIRTALLDANSINVGSIDFRDPWFIDFPDPTLGNQLRNRGVDAIFRTRTSPFNPNSINNYENGQKYNGVFLSQSGPPDWHSPYYTVRATLPTSVDLGGSIGTRPAFFSGWSASPSGSASFQNPVALETPVVFLQANATVSANLKVSRITSLNTAYTNSGQRKVVRSTNGWQHMVYESLGHVWYEAKPASGNWSFIPGMNGSRHLNSGAGKTPAIARTASTHPWGDMTLVAWQEANTIVMRIHYYSAAS